MFTIFISIVKDRKKALLIYCLTGILFLWLFIAFFPLMQEQTASVVELMEGMPEGFMKAFGVEKESFTTVEGFLAAKQYSATWPLMVILLLVAIAGTTIAGEIEKGSIEITLARPVSREKIFFGRYMAGTAMLLVFTFFSIYSVLPLSVIYDVDIQLSSIVKLSVIAFLFGLAVLSLSMFMSALLSEKSKVYMIVGALLISMYIMNTVALIKVELENIRYASFFNYLDTNGALILNEMSALSIWVFIGSAIAFTSVGAYIFNRRDIAA
ncbi:ABC transporter permease subunit [Patescibacteria group bacterium]|nr:ABC transporter permease subunit [Patescibacteria group bacterium]MBU1074613.1 ABC transporter permease subunit [Patescibacteria group bacterium]MBU1952402.1 ABC transporter permease subunit [Patescibacteria group bacterium]MBU2229374.1 ABC transporter permease subunit [Patescibacteria group bacterium]